jgi:hypothetical protein
MEQLRFAERFRVKHQGGCVLSFTKIYTVKTYPTS